MEKNQQKFLEALGLLIQKSRKEKNIKQEEVAEVIGITRYHLSNIEKGRSAMSIFVFFRLQQLLGFPTPSLDDVRIPESMEQIKSDREEKLEQRKQKIDAQIKELQAKKESLVLANS
jgi:transcriptional regulator with XRE-family HTH domain